jgi:hypothetical protein
MPLIVSGAPPLSAAACELVDPIAERARLLGIVAERS